MNTASELNTQLLAFLGKTREAAIWADGYGSSAGAANPVVLKQSLFEIAKSVTKYVKALNTRPAVGLFGESQVGKSFLVSILGAMPGKTSIEVVDHYSGKSYDFLKEINPKGGQVESTGIVTRFTVVPVKGSVATPYSIKLFTQAELVKIVANGYFLDFESEALRAYQFNPEEIYSVVSRLRSRKTAAKFPEFTEEDIVDIKAYLDRIALKSISVFNTSSFWEDAINILPYLPYNERWELLQFLWGKNEFFSSIFNKLSFGLSQTDFSRTLQIGEEALFPRERSIIDINRCNEILENAGINAETVNILCENGKVGKIAKSVLGALTAELEVNLPKEIVQNPDMDFLNESDILDFPGCRSRLLNKDDKFMELDTKGKLEVLKRGKVAFLFEKYTDDFSVNTLITCIPPRTMEVKQLANYLYEWVKLYVGDTPQKRLSRLMMQQKLPEFGSASIGDLVPLLMVMTMFDRDLADKGISMKNNDPDRWQGRFFQNYYQFFALEKTHENYLESWLPSGDQQFKNTFPIRNPHADGDANIFVQSVSEAGIYRETDTSEKYKVVLPEVREAFRNNQYVRKLVRNPDQVFESVASPGNYGAHALLKALNIVCRARIKESLIQAHFQETRDRFLAIFRQFDWDSDADQVVLKARTNAAKAYGALTILQAKKSAFGSLLNHFNLKEETSFGVYFKMVNDSLVNDDRPAGVLASDGAEPDEKISLNDYVQLLGIEVDGYEDQQGYFRRLKEFFALDSEEAIIEILEQANVDWKVIEKKDVKDRADDFSEELLTKWAGMIEELKSPEFCSRYEIRPEIVDLIVEQLNKSLLRLQLKHFISNSVREEIVNYHPVNNPNFDIVARISTSIVNRFVNSFGWQFAPVEERPLTLQDEIIFDESKVLIPARKEVVGDGDEGNNIIFDSWRIGLKQSFERNLTGNFESPDKLLAIRKLKEILTPLINQ